MDAHVLNKTGEELDYYMTPPKISLYCGSDHTQDITENWTDITCPMTDGNINLYTLRGSPDFDFVYNGTIDCDMMFAGDAVALVTGASGQIIEFGLFKGGVLQDKFSSVQEFPVATTLGTLGTNGNIVNSENDVFKVRARRLTGTGNLSITIRNLKVSMNFIDTM